MHLCYDCSEDSFIDGKETTLGLCDMCREENVLCQEFEDLPFEGAVPPLIPLDPTISPQDAMKMHDKAIRALINEFDEGEEGLEHLKALAQLPGMLLRSYQILLMYLINSYRLFNTNIDIPRALGLCLEYRLRLQNMLGGQGFLLANGEVNELAFKNLEDSVTQGEEDG